MSQHHAFSVFDNVHPIASSLALWHLLPWDHVSNSLWAIGTSVLSWGAVRLLAVAWKRWGPKDPPKG